MLGVDDGRAVVDRLAPQEHTVHHHEAGAEREGDHHALRTQAQAGPPLEREQEGRQERDRSVEQADQQARPVNAEPWHQHQREEQARHQRAHVVERQHPRDELFELEAEAQQPDEQRDLEPDQRAEHQHHAVERRAEGPERGVDRKQARGRDAADQGDAQLDFDEALEQPVLDEARQVRAHAHREQVQADH